MVLLLLPLPYNLDRVHGAFCCANVACKMQNNCAQDLEML